MIRFPWADNPHCPSVHSENENMQAGGKEAKGDGPVFAVVLAGVQPRLGGVEVETGSGGHIDAMLGEIGFVLVAVELNLHYLIVYTIKWPVNGNRRGFRSRIVTQKRTRPARCYPHRDRGCATLVGIESGDHVSLRHDSDSGRQSSVELLSVANTLLGFEIKSLRWVAASRPR